MGSQSYIKSVLDPYFNNIPVLLRVLILSLSTFTNGLLFTWSSPSIPKLNGSVDPENNPLEHPLEVHMQSWLASIGLLSACLGSLLPTLMNRRFRRKTSLTIITLPAITALLLFGFGRELWIFLVAQLLAGVTIGGSIQIVPRYIGEISENNNRGAMGCCFTIFMGLGSLFTFSVGPYTTFQTFNLIAVIFPVVFLILLTIFVENSPYDYVSDNEVKAKLILSKLRCKSKDEELMLELEDMRQVVRGYTEQLRLKDFYSSKALSKSLIVVLMLMVFQQASGIGIVMAYMQTIFSAAGGDIPPEQCAIIVSFIQFITTITIPQFIDRYGRKILLLIAQVFLIISTGTLGLYFYLKINEYNTESINWLPLICLLVYIIFFNAGLGGIPVILMGEIFPPNAQNVASTMAIATLTLTAFAVTWMFPILVESINIAYTFWIIASFSLIGFPFIALIVPETKGKSFMEIQALLEK